MKGSVKVGIVGLGMGRIHLQALKRMEGVEVSALCDVNEELLKKVGEEAGVQKLFTDFEQFISDDMDAAFICTPHFLHYEQVIAALRSGKHVFCEKPLAVTVKEADEMAKVARELGKKLAVGFQRRTNPKDRLVKQLIQELGEISRGLYEMLSLRTQAYYDSGAWRGTWWGEGGGVLINQAVHDLDIYQWWMGMPKLVFGMAETFAHEIETEDLASAIFVYENGAQVLFQASLVNHPGMSRFEVSGEMGCLIYDGNIRLAKIDGALFDFIRTCPEAWGKPPEVTWQDVQAPQEEWGHAALVKDFIDSIVEDREPLVSGEEGIKSVELVNAIIMSTILREPVELPLERASYEALMEDLRAGRRSLPRRASQP
ncbi:MAG: Gfo/Idh/MocA family oxidoreductase [Armatimonadota bacterium]|nr:Gfo/Idh/MocA family oxidoreductase [Armatimonadota bacterium]MCX7777695.1 Gfo/Idh/MocA family oxidoreductase [Armatimonadota bacterium]MDW8025454.1 Gfo/Idh/MocA family oxidoreductase [Armatimonadota bacterium]